MLPLMSDQSCILRIRSSHFSAEQSMSAVQGGRDFLLTSKSDLVLFHSFYLCFLQGLLLTLATKEAIITEI